MKRWFLFLFLFVSGLGFGIVGTKLSAGSQGNILSHQVRQGGYTYINPLLECEVSFEQQPQAKIVSLKRELVEKINTLTLEKGISKVSLYFRELNNGSTLDIDGSDDFSPASLLKLPLMIAYFKQSEQDESLLKQKVTVILEGDMNAIETIKPKNPIVLGKTYTNEYLIRSMIVDSDNNAMAILMQNLSNDIQNQVYEDLGVPLPWGNDIVSVKGYSSFFRILYNASYLSREDSEKALSILSETHFDSGITAGVPRGIKVANKFGEREVGSEKQLHDCGIVYVPDKPYLLCIMTRGTNFDAMADAISMLSKTIYDRLK